MMLFVFRHQGTFARTDAEGPSSFQAKQKWIHCAAPCCLQGEASNTFLHFRAFLKSCTTRWSASAHKPHHVCRAGVLFSRTLCVFLCHRTTQSCWRPSSTVGQMCSRWDTVLSRPCMSPLWLGITRWEENKHPGLIIIFFFDIFLPFLPVTGCRYPPATWSACQRSGCCVFHPTAYRFLLWSWAGHSL